MWINNRCVWRTLPERKKNSKIIFRNGYQSSSDFWYPFMSVQRTGLLSLLGRTNDLRWSWALLGLRGTVFFFSDAKPSSRSCWTSDNGAWWHFLIGFLWHPRVVSTPVQESQGHNNSMECVTHRLHLYIPCGCSPQPFFQWRHIVLVSLEHFLKHYLCSVVAKIHSSSTGITQK